MTRLLLREVDAELSVEPLGLSPHPFFSPLPLKGILRPGLEEVRQFFALNGACRLPLSPSLLVKGIVPRVSLC